MRARRRRHGPRIRRRPGMKGDWVVAAFARCGIPITAFPDCEAVPVTTDLVDFALIDDTDVAAKEDSLTVCRVVGEIHPMIFATWEIATPAALEVTFYEGIYKTTVGDTTAVILDPRNDVDIGSDSWLWLRRRTATFFTIGAGPKLEWWSPADYAEGMNDHIDLRVKRKINFGEELIYVCGTTKHVFAGDLPFSLLGQLQFTLRAYVKF